MTKQMEYDNTRLKLYLMCILNSLKLLSSGVGDTIDRGER